MYAVVRETTYPPAAPLAERPEFNAFQDKHAALPNCLKTIVTHIGNGRHITVTVWDTADHMNAAHETIGPAVKTLIEPIMTAPAKLLGAGEVAYADVSTEDARL